MRRKYDEIRKKTNCQNGDSDTSLCLHKTSLFYFMQIWHSCQLDVFLFKFIERKYNILFYKNKTKLLLFFFLKVFTFASLLAYTSGFKYHRPNNFSLAIARPTREIVHQSNDVAIVSMLAFIVEFEPRSGQINDYDIGLCCFSSKHTALRSKSKHCLARNYYNVPEWSVLI